MNKKDLGCIGEQSAVKFLLKNNYKILERNYKVKIGEIDIIAKDKEDIVFLEVKTRTNTNYGLPCQAVDFRKQITIGKVAVLYLAKNNLSNQNCRFDIIEVLVNDDGNRITHIKNAFQPKIF